MKHKPFNKQVITLVMGSLMICSGQALAISSNHKQELSNVDALGNSETLVTQDTQKISSQQQALLCQSIARANNTLGTLLAVFKATPVLPAMAKNTRANLLAKAITLIGEAFAKCQPNVLTKRDAAAIFNELSQVKTLLDDACSLAFAAVPNENVQRLRQSCSMTEKAVGDASAIANLLAK